MAVGPIAFVDFVDVDPVDVEPSERWLRVSWGWSRIFSPV